MSLYALLRCELRALFTNSAILLTVFGGLVFYSFLYPLPYTQQIPREQRVVVVNLDGSQLSRKLERMVDATPQVRISGHATSLEEARERFSRGEISGILLVPENFHRDLLQGRQPTLSFAGDASYFLVYGTVLEGLAGAGQTLAAQVKITRMIMSGQPASLAVEQYSSIRLGLQSMFNPTGGYVNYVIPAVFILILHQTLIIGTGILGGTQNEERRSDRNHYTLKASPGWLLAVRTMLFLAIYWLFCLYYFGFCYDFYQIPRHAGILELQLLVLPFLLAATFFGECLGALLPRRELATLIVLLSSMVLIFGSGFIWPVSELPRSLVVFLQLVPVIPAIRAFLLINQLGATLHDVLPQLAQLWGLAAGYGVFAWYLAARTVGKG